jgi:hypothetical protein
MNLMTISGLKYETKSGSEDIQVLQINLHRGSLSSINREQRSKAGLALAAASDVTIGLIFWPRREPVHISIDHR